MYLGAQLEHIGGPMFIYFENVNGSSGPITYGDGSPFGDNEWHKVEIYIKHNRDGVPDGIMRIWQDGRQLINAENVISHTPGAKWGQFTFLSNWSQTAHDNNNHVYFDDIEIFSDLGSGAIGLMSDATITEGANMSAPPPPSDLSIRLSITKLGTGTGTVTSSPAGINCGSSCSASYNSGTLITLSALAAPGSTFAGWSGSGCTTGSVILNSNVSCTATFNISTVAPPTNTNIARNECANPPAGAIFCADFEGINSKAAFDDYDQNSDTENQIVADLGPSKDSSNKVIRFRVPIGQSGGADLVKVFSTGYDKLFARWYIKYEDGFNFNAGNHGGGLAAGDRNFIGSSGYRPNGSDFAGFYLQYQENTARPYSYSYYRGMYQDCSNAQGSCWGDSLPCVYDSGVSYCTNQQDRPSASLPTFQAGTWYCVEQMVDMGTPTTTQASANGHLALWLDGQQYGDFQNLWIRTTPSLKLQNLWLNLFHPDANHSAAGELIDNVVVSTQRIGCGGTIQLALPGAPTNLNVQ
jgi:hypothetical protein